jgi:lactate dehydrogenase-like 2-hydroxyacid dehydrogenase
MAPVSANLPETIGVVGAGTMGAGIAQLAAQAGARTLLHDPIPEALERGINGIGQALDRLVERGKLSADDAAALKGRIEPASALADLAPPRSPSRKGSRRCSAASSPSAAVSVHGPSTAATTADNTGSRAIQSD